MPPQAKVRSTRSTWLHPRIRQPLIYALVACLVVYVIELAVERMLAGDAGHSQLTESIVGLSGIYQRLVTAGWRKPQPRFTVIVEIDPTADSQLEPFSYRNPCRQRMILAELIERLAASNPAVIVIDKFFGRNTCDEDPAHTLEFVNTVNSIGTRIPIVLGRRVLPGYSQVDSDRELPVEPFLALTGAPRLSEGILNLHGDSRRMALRWCGTAHRTGGSVEVTILPSSCETLAVKAAKAYDSQLLIKYGRLNWLLEKGEHPYISFMRPDQFCRFAIRAVLGEVMQPDHAGPCPTSKGRVDSEYLRNRIVVVGERSIDIDYHYTVIGEMPGFIVQANFIEALLDDRYFRPVPWLDYFVGAVLFVSIKLTITLLHHTPWKAVGLTSLIIATTLAVVLVLILLLGLYVNPLGVSVLAVVINAGHPIMSWIARVSGYSQ